MLIVHVGIKFRPLIKTTRKAYNNSYQILGSIKRMLVVTEQEVTGNSIMIPNNLH